MKVAKRTAQFQVKFDKDDSGKIVKECNWAKLENKTSEEKAKGNKTKPDKEEGRHGFRLSTKGIGNQMKLRIETTMADGDGGGQMSVALGGTCGHGLPCSLTLTPNFLSPFLLITDPD